ncbi:MAG: NADP-dependent phosphogluconate dehydrogenase [Bacteroidetes bacterium]|nr:NADP-dependent phosphogluconate dehydrogenase [Bacteroidota bacterium]
MENTHNGQYQFGMIGLGTMGRNLLLNMADYGVAVAGYDKNADQISLLEKAGEGKKVKGFTDLGQLVQSLKAPRAVMMLVPAGPIVDSVIADLKPLLEKGDLIIDGGNSKFTDTERRAVELENIGLHFFGMGISGGEEGARRGPSMMPGGDKDAYQHVKPIFDKIAAKVNGEPCVTYIGPGASGHFVKMVHNGIEYAIMQLLAETYDLMKNGLQMNNEAIHTVFKDWNDGRLHSFLMEITRDIFAFKDPNTSQYLLDEIKDEAKSKGTGKWTSQFAMDLQSPTPAIDVAVSMRDLSKYKSLRVQLAEKYPNDKLGKLANDSAGYLTQLEEAFYFAMTVIYAQGMHLLYLASIEYKYELHLAEIAKIWRGGCIIRSKFLEDIYAAFNRNEELEHLFLDDNVKISIKANLNSARSIITGAMQQGFSVPVFSASLNYFDALRTGRMPTNLIQAQRDYFGAHTYELIGKEGVFHTKWNA